MPATTSSFFFFLIDRPPPEFSPLPQHAPLPIYAGLGHPLAFNLWGEGPLAAPADENGQGGGGGMQAQAGANRPGGGLGPPIDAPPPLRQIGRASCRERV